MEIISHNDFKNIILSEYDVNYISDKISLKIKNILQYNYNIDLHPITVKLNPIKYNKSLNFLQTSYAIYSIECVKPYSIKLKKYIKKCNF
jgi:hypothetical protein